MNHFELFGLAPAVDLDVAALEQKHRALALELHPDRNSGADARTRRLLAERTADINEAVKVLRDPVRRAFYLLKLRGVDLESDQQAAKHPMPPEFLEEVLERREALEEAKQAGDLVRARAMAAEVAQLKRTALEQARAALAQDEAGALREATVALARVRYFSRYLEEVDAMEEEALSA